MEGYNYVMGIVYLDGGGLIFSNWGCNPLGCFRLWYLVFKWLGMVLVLPLDFSTLFSIFYCGVVSRKGLIMICHVVL